MVYEYGSAPPPEYNFKTFVRTIAPVLPENDRVFFNNNSLDWRNTLDQIPLALFRNICHWKSPRPFNRVRNNRAETVNKQWNKALQQLANQPFNDRGIKYALKQLTELKGVSIRTASALLTAWNPREFGIMDFKTLKVLAMGESDSRKRYVEFRSRLLELRNELPELKKCAIRQIELALWHYYPIQEAGRKKRAGR